MRAMPQRRAPLALNRLQGRPRAPSRQRASSHQKGRLNGLPGKVEPPRRRRATRHRRAPSRRRATSP